MMFRRGGWGPRARPGEGDRPEVGRLPVDEADLPLRPDVLEVERALMDAR